MDEAFLNDLLECSVCLEQLDGTSKVLPCQHTFCKRCLEEIVNSHKELRCPECRVLVETKVDGLPSNILLIRLLEGIKNNPRLTTPAVNAQEKKVESSTSSQRVVPPKSSHVHGPRQGMPASGERKTVPKQALQTPPCAKALYPYEGKEPGDLSFKKGDIIILQRRIDQNWYHGEVNGKYGFLPARYVQVMVPLPTHIPQCKALFDFSVGENDEKDCLTFNKGEVITVIRRVDDNWAEGKLSDKIGIFPISFVEMNVAARSLMKLSVNTQPGPSRVAPPTPTTDSSRIPIPPVTNPGIGISITAPQTLDSLSSTTTTPSPASSSSPSTPSSSNSSPSMPPVSSFPPSLLFNVSEATPSVLKRSASQRSSHQKRHSLSSLSPWSSHKVPQIPVGHRHSLEILSTSGGDILAAPQRTIFGNTSSITNPFCTTTPTTMQSAGSTTKEDIGSRIIWRHTHRDRENSKLPTSNATVTSSTPVSPTPSSNVTQAVPSTYYMALYNYRPQKEDELELKKGELYTVSEKCQDGWFKGISIRNGGSGVFPGNYVHTAKSSGHQAHFHHTSSSVASVRTTSTKSLLPVASVPPRPKPPATSFPQPTISSANLNSETAPIVYTRPKPPSQETRTSVAAGLLEWARSVATVSNARPPFTHGTSPSVTPRKQEFVKENESPVTKTPDVIPWLGKSAPVDSARIVAPTTNSCIAQTTSMAASYPSAATQAQQNSSNLPTSCSVGSISQSWQGSKTPSFPLHSHTTTSTSVMTPPNVSLKAFVPHSSHSKADKHKVRKDKTRESLMKRLTSKRKTCSPPVTNFSCDNPSFVDSPTPTTQAPVAIIHVRSGSCPSEALGGQNANQKKNSQAEGTRVETPKSLSRLKQPSLVRERFRCVVPYPPNSEYELELKVGDIVYVHKKRDDGWYKGTLLRTGKTGLFPASFVDSF